MIRISKQALTSKIEAYGLFVYIKIELYGFTAIALWQVRQKWIEFIQNWIVFIEKSFAFNFIEE